MKVLNKKQTNEKTYIIVIDTETADGFVNPNVYDLGYVIYNLTDGKIEKYRSYLSKQVYDNPTEWETAFYKNKRDLYEQKLADGIIKKCYWGTICRILQVDLDIYKPDGIYAYNSRFDFKAIKGTCERNNSKINPTADGILDIMNYIKSITETEQYKEFCFNNGFLTAHKPPRPQQKAETLYRYLTNQTDYLEEHTALEDSKIELDILLQAMGWKK